MFSSRTLFKAGQEGLSKNSTFLITSQSTTVSAQLFLMMASTACTDRCIAQDLLSKILNWFAVEPVSNGHISNIILFAQTVKFMIFLTADAQTAIPIDVQFVPRRVAKYLLVRHGSPRSCQQDHSQLLVVRS